MTPEQMAAVVLRWVRAYTRHLPAPVADRRIQEITADLLDQIEHGRASGADEAQIVRALASRMVRGIGADTSWRRERRLTEDSMSVRTVLTRPAARVALGVGVVLAFPAIATPAGAADWSIGDFVLAALLLALIGTTLEVAVRSAGSVVAAAALTALGVAAAFAGDADDAPGLTLIGVLLVASAGLLFVRRSGRAG